MQQGYSRKWLISHSPITILLKNKTKNPVKHPNKKALHVATTEYIQFKQKLQVPPEHLISNLMNLDINNAITQQTNKVLTCAEVLTGESHLI